MALDTDGFTGASIDINTSDIANFASSLESEPTQTDRTNTRTSGSASQTGSITGSASETGAAAGSSATTFSTSVTPSAGSDASASLNNDASGTATNAASNTSNGVVTVSEKGCSSISCSPGLQAAIAVPVVIAALVAFFLFFFCVRRRRKRNIAGAGAVVSEKRPPKAGKKWTRHLRAFSFDAELLMGGRFSSTNSLRSREASVRSGPASRNGAHSAEPSLHSVEEVAPPYRDAVSHAQPPSPALNRSIPAVTTIQADPIPRSSSSATAPPPYRSIVGETMSPNAPTSASATRNPFADSAPVSPIEGSPFNDPPEEAGGAALSRNSSMYRSVNSDDLTPDGSEAGSIREAVVGRRVSIRNTAGSGSSN